MKTLRFIKVSIAAFLLAYLLAAFVNASFDFRDWSYMARAFTAMLWPFLIAGILIGEQV